MSQGHFSHAERLAIARAGKDDVLHVGAAQGLWRSARRAPSSPRRECSTLPHPFGPTTTAMPVPGTVSSVRSQKLLKPRMWIFFSFSMLTPSQMGHEQLRSQPNPATCFARRSGEEKTLFDYRL